MICVMMIVRPKLGCFNCELKGRAMSEMLGLNPKYYAFKYQHTEKQRSTKISCR